MSKYWIDRLGGPGKADPRGDRSPDRKSRIERQPEHGAGNEYGPTEPYGSHDSEPVHRPRDDDTEVAT